MLVHDVGLTAPLCCVDDGAVMEIDDLLSFAIYVIVCAEMVLECMATPTMLESAGVENDDGLDV